jgi:hypothetical protein
LKGRIGEVELGELPDVGQCGDAAFPDHGVGCVGGEDAAEADGAGDDLFVEGQCAIEGKGAGDFGGVIDGFGAVELDVNPGVVVKQNGIDDVQLAQGFLVGRAQGGEAFHQIKEVGVAGRIGRDVEKLDGLEGIGAEFTDRGEEVCAGGLAGELGEFIAPAGLLDEGDGFGAEGGAKAGAPGRRPCSEFRW